MPSIINVMITTTFNFGSYTDDKAYPLVADTLDAQYAIGLTLLGIVAVLIPVYLFVKPCVLAKEGGHEDNDEIEFTDINRGD